MKSLTKVYKFYDIENERVIFFADGYSFLLSLKNFFTSDMNSFSPGLRAAGEIFISVSLVSPPVAFYYERLCLVGPIGLHPCKVCSTSVHLSH